jgi:hypothetical protein
MKTMIDPKKDKDINLNPGKIITIDYLADIIMSWYVQIL